jgi:type IV pilus assembly protein PilC
MNYQYRARDPLGNTHEGSIEAATLDDAGQQLRRDGFQVLDIDEDDGPGLFGGRISRSDVIYVTNQLAIMVDTGITLSTALEGIVEQEQNTTLRNVLADLRDSVAAGEDFSTALTRYPKLFDKTYVSLIRASEATGTLGPMLERIAGYLRKDMETRGKVRAAMAYPAVMMVLAVGVTIFLLTYILPKFTPLFESRGTELPGITTAMMTASKVLLGYWYAWLAGLVVFIVGFLVFKRTEPGRQTLDYVRINLPIVGPVARKVTISRSIRTLGTMLASGVPIMDSLKLAAQVSGNYHYEQLWHRVLDEVTAGRRVADSLRNDPLFPRMLVQMISAGEETGKLDQVLEKVSTYYDREVETSIKAATSTIEPLMIAAMGVVVGTIAMALLLPIFSLSKQP